ncbi:hypothetical protein [Stackebrandtia soli]|uniref:hypothetical protein n=1 Tax=Stackebrandtia soli TaxID=1892856 RepID=UPI0039E9097D
MKPTTVHRALRAGLLTVALTLGLTVVTTTATVSDAFAIDHSKGTPGFCPDGDGVTVVIDFQELGGSTIVRCAPGDQATGHAALKNAGIEIAGTNRWGEAFICRIEGKPGPADEPCIDTPPASAYWSYWHAPNNGNWTYSQWGVMNRKPPPGSFEGWSFSKDRTSTTNPPPRVAPSRPVPADDPDDGGPDDEPQRPGSSKPDDGDNSTKDTKEEDEASASPSTLDEGTPGPSDTPTEVADWTGGDELASTSVVDDGTIPGSTLAGIGAVALLSTFAGIGAWRRRANRSASSA